MALNSAYVSLLVVKKARYWEVPKWKAPRRAVMWVTKLVDSMGCLLVQ